MKPTFLLSTIQCLCYPGYYCNLTFRKRVGPSVACFGICHGKGLNSCTSKLSPRLGLSIRENRTKIRMVLFETCAYVQKKKRPVQLFIVYDTIYDTNTVICISYKNDCLSICLASILYACQRRLDRFRGAQQGFWDLQSKRLVINIITIRHRRIINRNHCYLYTIVYRLAAVRIFSVRYHMIVGDGCGDENEDRNGTWTSMVT